MFSQYCADKYTAEYCEVVAPDGTATRYPELGYREEVVNIQKTNQYIGIRWMIILCIIATVLVSYLRERAEKNNLAVPCML